LGPQRGYEASIREAKNRSHKRQNPDIAIQL